MTLSDSRLSNLGAARILKGFDRYMGEFRKINRRASGRFEARDWSGIQSDAVERLDLYAATVTEVVSTIETLLRERSDDSVLWVAIKAVYSSLISARQDWELAETFFNSITRKVFTTVGVDSAVEFVDTDFDSPPSPSEAPVYRTYEESASIVDLVREILDDASHEVAYADLDANVIEVASRIEKRLASAPGLGVVDRAEVVGATFYRGQAAYVVGLLYSGSQEVPIVMALRNSTAGVVVDAVLLTENEVSILFSFTRSYFHVDVVRPYDLVRFLRRLMPRKRIAELYISIGHNKHGKTELYRDLLRHLQATNERFEHARGTRGLVMIVFTMPGYDDVFKVIRDRFAPPKRTTRRTVMARYKMVFQHDRAGRLMDVQDFQHLQFDRSRFSEELLDELLTEASRTVSMQGDSVIVSHVYVERRIVPLDLYVREARPAAAADAVLDYGQAIKDLASTNIFPGDLLMKNFGVTRHGRVVFYDYDELSPLTDVRFREMPEPRDDHDAMSDQPWFAVGERDVFPEEHEHFLGLNPELKSRFNETHSDLFRVQPWIGIQERIRNGELIEVFPYSEEARLADAAGFRGW
ncbi:MAG TPA: bifunctional isocitrate dehydrogenase kinase/phosphatase [Acidimicrobiia bacterium]|nr:bifunctional isocitrate dehydrogenase kinase/phosphatase [Acidimicrobiia bacterium]